MTTATAQSAAPVLSKQLRQRLETLGVTILRASPDGRAEPQGPCRWIEQLLVGSAPFAAAVRAKWPQLVEQIGCVIEVWPGVLLIPLPLQRQRRVATDPARKPLLAVLLLGPQFLASEQLRLVCDAEQLDLRATIGRVKARFLVGPEEGLRLALILTWMQEDASEVDRRLTEIHSMSEELANSYEELSLLYKLSTNMTVDQPPEAFLTEATRELQQVVGLRWMTLQLTDKEPRLEALAGEIFAAGPIDCDGGRLRQLGSQLMERFGGSDQPMIIDDTTALEIPILGRIARNLLVIPLRSENQPLGILYGGEKLDESHITTVDSKLCDSLANSLTIFLENMMLYGETQAMFLGTLHALTSAIDAKDTYTHGHSERVAQMTRMLSEAVGLDAHTIDRAYLAGVVHDVGKIGVPEAVLCKPGKLTQEEFDQIKRHPGIGVRILQDIQQMQDLIPGVMYHHERWDGKGYPHQLRGNQIPMFGRLIGLADAFDAMSSDRTYRRALNLSQVLDEVRSCAGTQFDPALAQVFVKLDFETYFWLIAKHQHQQVRQSA